MNSNEAVHRPGETKSDNALYPFARSCRAQGRWVRNCHNQGVKPADMLPDFGGQDGPTRADAQAAIDEPALAPTVRHLQALGSVHMGMLSGWAFVEL